jgi:hypothetical protein
MIKISEGVFIVDVAKFLDVYNTRCESISVLSEGCKIRHEQYLKAINENK